MEHSRFKEMKFICRISFLTKNTYIMIKNYVFQREFFLSNTKNTIFELEIYFARKKKCFSLHLPVKSKTKVTRMHQLTVL